ncbi:mycofactocin-coupled SDR family oxidoreductase [Conexibacter sp. CPCC 206217]|uniref:mycofactocin-coupled SDR family oxidoreductase n=1 Tax=Conexibacter sp. CPCC 206217 TaxID=3064574 RepID=UPI002723F2FA|nr:mycofactocin-coupled SDR family oxidoreductase [Conexibacter sp. CPCC 206217]MDO8210191.1 mycofactocin-coupled SDR family oxidoreductase [Conexibacter sp. CPCC 206217]
MSAEARQPLEGRVALITGGARGQGRSHALTLAKAGADVAICDIAGPIDTIEYPLATPGELAETVSLVEGAGRRCLAAVADVRDLDAMREFASRTASELGRIDVVVGNAGVYSHAPNTWELTERQWDVMLDVNLSGVWKTCVAAIPHMLDGDGGAIVLISSVNGLRGVPGVAHYNVAKHGLVGLVRTLAIELAAHGIRVNALHPTAVRTAMVENDVMPRAFATIEAAGIDLRNLLDVEMLDPSDVSDALLWLVSPSARHVTGISLPVDAGNLVR